MRHLHVEHRILFGLALGEIDIEHEVRVALPHEKEVADRVPPDFVDQIANRQVAAGALGDFDLLAASHHRHHLVQHVFGIAVRDPHLECLQAHAHAQHGTMVIGALHVDRPREAALPFGDVIRDVRHEVRVVAALCRALAHHAVLVVAEIGRPQPARAVLLVRVSRGDEAPFGLIDLAIGVEGGLERVHIEPDAKRLEIAILFFAERLDRKAANRVEIRSACVLGMRREVALGDLANVLAVITPFGDCHGAPAQLGDPGLHAVREVRDLPAAVVVVELARHPPTGPFEQRRDGVTERGLTAVTDVEWPGGIRRNELDVDGATLPHVAPPVRRSRRKKGRQRTHDLRLRQEEVDESGAGDFHLADQARRQLDVGHQALGNGAGFLRERLRERQREVGGQVAMRGIPRALDGDVHRGRAES